MSPLILMVVLSNNFYVKDNNTRLAPNKAEFAKSIINDMSKRFDEKILEMRDDPAKFEQAVKRAEERNK